MHPLKETLVKGYVFEEELYVRHSSWSIFKTPA